MSRYLGEVLLDNTELSADASIKLVAGNGSTTTLVMSSRGAVRHGTFEFPGNYGSSYQALGTAPLGAGVTWYTYALKDGNTLGVPFTIGTLDTHNFTIMAGNSASFLSLDALGGAALLKNTYSTFGSALSLRDNTTNDITIAVPATVTAYSAILPPAAGVADNVLMVDSVTGSDVSLKWATVSTKFIFSTVSANTTLTASANAYKVDTTAGNVTLTLPALASTTTSGITYQILKIAAGNTVTIAPATGERIDGVVDATLTLTALYDRVGIMNFDDTWVTI